MGLPRQGHWTWLPFPSSGELPNPGIKPKSPALAGGFWKPPGKLNAILLLPKVKELKLPLSSADPKTEAWWGQQGNTGQHSGQPPLTSTKQPTAPAAIQKQGRGARQSKRRWTPRGGSCLVMLLMVPTVIVSYSGVVPTLRLMLVQHANTHTQGSKKSRWGLPWWSSG